MKNYVPSGLLLLCCCWFMAELSLVNAVSNPIWLSLFPPSAPTQPALLSLESVTKARHVPLRYTVDVLESCFTTITMEEYESTYSGNGNDKMSLPKTLWNTPRQCDPTVAFAVEPPRATFDSTLVDQYIQEKNKEFIVDVEHGNRVVLTERPRSWNPFWSHRPVRRPAVDELPLRTFGIVKTQDASMTALLQRQIEMIAAMRKWHLVQPSIDGDAGVGPLTNDDELMYTEFGKRKTVPEKILIQAIDFTQKERPDINTALHAVVTSVHRQLGSLEIVTVGHFEWVLFSERGDVLAMQEIQPTNEIASFPWILPIELPLSAHVARITHVPDRALLILTERYADGQGRWRKMGRTIRHFYQRHRHQYQLGEGAEEGVVDDVAKHQNEMLDRLLTQLISEALPFHPSTVPLNVLRLRRV